MKFKTIICLVFLLCSFPAFAGLPAGSTVTSAACGVSDTCVLYNLGGTSLTVGSGANLAAAKTSGSDWCDAQVTAYGTIKTSYQDMTTALAGAPGATHAGTDGWGTAITINEYTVGGVVYYLQSTEVSADTTHYNELITNVNNAVTFLGDLKAAVNAL